MKARCIGQCLRLMIAASLTLQYAAAAELQVMASNAVTTSLTRVKSQFEQTTGDSLSVRYDTTNAIRSAIEGGAEFDVAILTTAADQALVESQRVVPGSIVPIARGGIGVVVRTGLPKPDISTPAAFRQALLDARSVSYTSTGVSGMYVDGLLKQLGLADSLAAKSVRPQGGAVAALVARGEADLGIQQISELLPVAGVDYIGPLPPPLQHFTEFSAAISLKARHVRSANTLIQLLQTPAARADLPSHGMEPPVPRAVTSE